MRLLPRVAWPTALGYAGVALYVCFANATTPSPTTPAPGVTTAIPPERTVRIHVDDTILIPGSELYDIAATMPGVVTWDMTAHGIYRAHASHPGTTVIMLTPKALGAFPCLSCQVVRYRLVVTSPTEARSVVTF